MSASITPGKVAMVVLVGGSSLGELLVDEDFFVVEDLVEDLLFDFEGAAVAGGGATLNVAARSRESKILNFIWAPIPISRVKINQSPRVSHPNLRRQRIIQQNRTGNPPMTTQTQDLEALISQSSATEEFKEAVRGLDAGQTSPLIKTNTSAPRVKVMRVITKLLEAEPELAIRNVELRGASSCSGFRGDMKINDGEVLIDFNWDCAWRAEKEGWRDAFGYVDQGRAARQFGYQCFEKFDRI